METKKKWKERDNDTLIDLHKKSIYNKKLYKKASDFYNFLNNLIGFTSIITSSMATSILWIEYDGSAGDDDNTVALKALISITTILLLMQNLFNFIDSSYKYLEISKSYGDIQYNVEYIGDIHPIRRDGNPKVLLPKLRNRINKILQERKSINHCLISLFTIKEEDESYMTHRHERFKKNISEMSSDESDIDIEVEIPPLENRHIIT